MIFSRRSIATVHPNYETPAIYIVWPRFIRYFASGRDVRPERIKPRLEVVHKDTWQSDLFRLASLTWSIPVSNGYGRRLRFLVWDSSRQPRKTVWRICSSSVHSAKVTSQTSFGFTHWIFSGTLGGFSNGDFSVKSGFIRLSASWMPFSVKPLPECPK